MSSKLSLRRPTLELSKVESILCIRLCHSVDWFGLESLVPSTFTFSGCQTSPVHLTDRLPIEPLKLITSRLFRYQLCHQLCCPAAVLFLFITSMSCYISSTVKPSSCPLVLTRSAGTSATLWTVWGYLIHDHVLTPCPLTAEFESSRT